MPCCRRWCWPRPLWRALFWKPATCARPATRVFWTLPPRWRTVLQGPPRWRTAGWPSRSRHMSAFTIWKTTACRWNTPKRTARRHCSPAKRWTAAPHWARARAPCSALKPRTARSGAAPPWRLPRPICATAPGCCWRCEAPRLCTPSWRGWRSNTPFCGRAARRCWPRRARCWPTSPCGPPPPPCASRMSSSPPQAMSFAPRSPSSRAVCRPPPRSRTAGTSCWASRARRWRACSASPRNCCFWPGRTPTSCVFAPKSWSRTPFYWRCGRRGARPCARAATS